MKRQKSTYLLYLIGATIVITVAIQLYWNIQNYKTNKQRLINEVQISLDNGVEAYYSDLAKTDFMAFVEDSSRNLHLSSKQISWNHQHDSTFLEIESNLDSLRIFGNVKGFTQILDSTRSITEMKPNEFSSVSVIRGTHTVDSIQSLAGLTNRILVSITSDSLDYKKLDSLFKKELKRKDIAIVYELKHLLHNTEIGQFNDKKQEAYELSTFAKSTYLPDAQRLQLFYTNPTLAILKRSLTGILLSFLLSACIIMCLFYLLNIIKKQKALAEMKNDLISNITHEFKTPIATVSTAIEGIKNFNQNNDKVKTATYLDISEQQLKKLHLMVEKLLETATLDSDKLMVNKQETDLVVLLKSLVAKYQLLAPEKNILFKANTNSIRSMVDQFHFENALANLIDNAIKYGGETIEVNLISLLDTVEITVADNGGKIDKSQREKIFDKFYRIPTGNKHDVKGFGIGLYYSKKIVDKHGGELSLLPDSQNTIFKITL